MHARAPVNAFRQVWELPSVIALMLADLTSEVCSQSKQHLQKRSAGTGHAVSSECTCGGSGVQGSGVRKRSADGHYAAAAAGRHADAEPLRRPRTHLPGGLHWQRDDPRCLQHQIRRGYVFNAL